MYFFLFVSYLGARRFAGKIKKPNIKTLGNFIECILILHNILIDNEVPILEELDRPYVGEEPYEPGGNSPPGEEFQRSRELRASVAKYLALLPQSTHGEYTCNP